jgi:hypothetical protein
LIEKMSKGAATFEQKAAWMREHQAGPTVPGPPTPTFAERHYSVAEVAAMWSLSQDAVRKIFQAEPGVLVLGGHGSPHKRRYTTLRIPESVLQRVHRRLANI